MDGFFNPARKKQYIQNDTKKKKKNPKKLFVAEARSHIFVVFRA
jgi:hypothetical protein